MKAKISPSISKLINVTLSQSYWTKFDYAVQNLQLSQIDEKTKQLQDFMATR